MADAAVPDESFAEEPLRLSNKWDPSEVKRVLDEYASQARSTRPRAPWQRLSRQPAAVCPLPQVVLDGGYEEDMFISNTKIGAAARRSVPRGRTPG
jgi:hypothetical protein